MTDYSWPARPPEGGLPASRYRPGDCVQTLLIAECAREGRILPKLHRSLVRPQGNIDDGADRTFGKPLPLIQQLMSEATVRLASHPCEVFRHCS